MKINPELQRNLWLELSATRLLSMTFILGLIFLLAASDNAQAVTMVALAAFGLLTVLWGSRMASEAILDEIRERTWDMQKMTSINPWEMCWGKLLGGTIYAWYGGLISLAVFWVASSLTSEGANNPGTLVFLAVFTALLSQSMSLLISLPNNSGTNLGVKSTSGAVLAIPLVLMAALWTQTDESGNTLWYGQQWATNRFIAASMASFCCWSILGIYRSLCSELQVATRPWAWPLLLVFITGYLTGFSPSAATNSPTNTFNLFINIGYWVSAIGIYVTLFIEPKDPVAFRHLQYRIQSRQWWRVTTVIPSWFSCLLILLTFTLGVLIFGTANIIADLPLTMTTTILLFVLRDIALVIFIHLSPNPKRSSTTALFSLVLLHLLLPWLLAVANISFLAGLLTPFAMKSPIWLMPLIGSIEAMALLYLIKRRWLKLFPVPGGMPTQQ